jgi:hypothetical protein
MNANIQPVRTIPGNSVFIKVSQPVVAGKTAIASATILVPFDSIKHMLSDKPLRRPSRLRPLD